ncbi:MAG: hypothetical protein U0792_20160 [Gemmataceae bacterium]
MAIGKVKGIHSWQAGKMGWLLADDRPKDTDLVPAGVHWDEWLGVAPERPFKKTIYHSFNWRGFLELLERATWRLRLPHPRPGVRRSASRLHSRSRRKVRCRAGSGTSNRW